MKARPASSYLFFTSFIVLVVFGTTVFFYATQIKIPYLSFTKQIIESLYQPSINIFVPGDVQGISTQLFFYFIALVSLLISLLWMKLSGQELDREMIGRQLIGTTASVFLLVTILQTLGLGLHFQKYITLFSGKTLAQKEEFLFGDIYWYAVRAKFFLPGRHKAEFLTDMDMSRDPGMYNHRALAYFLYPIDIRGVQDGEKDSLLLYQKIGSLQPAPDDYQFFRIWDDENGIALKRSAAR